jgi:3-oxoadipate enol-lactonase
MCELSVVEESVRMPTAILASGQVIGYEDSGGAGEPLLVVFGFGDTRASTPPAWVETLAADFRVVRIDNRGAGLSSAPDGPFSIEDMAADAIALLDSLGIARAHLYGHSMGGMICQAIARDYPDRVCRVVLEATAPSAAASTASPRTPGSPAAAILARLAAEDPARDHEPALAAHEVPLLWDIFFPPGFFQSEAGRRVTAEIEAAYARAPGPSRRTMRWQGGAVQAFDNWGRLGEIRAETLVVHPSEDLKPLEHAEKFAQSLGNGRLHVVEGVGHNLRWEIPEAAARMLTAFYLGRLQADPGGGLPCRSRGT